MIEILHQVNEVLDPSYEKLFISTTLSTEIFTKLVTNTAPLTVIILLANNQLGSKLDNFDSFTLKAAQNVLELSDDSHEIEEKVLPTLLPDDALLRKQITTGYYFNDLKHATQLFKVFCGALLGLYAHTKHEAFEKLQDSMLLSDQCVESIIIDMVDGLEPDIPPEEIEKTYTANLNHLKAYPKLLNRASLFLRYCGDAGFSEELLNITESYYPENLIESQSHADDDNNSDNYGNKTTLEKVTDSTSGSISQESSLFTPLHLNQSNGEAFGSDLKEDSGSPITHLPSLHLKEPSGSSGAKSYEKIPNPIPNYQTIFPYNSTYRCKPETVKFELQNEIQSTMFIRPSHQRLYDDDSDEESQEESDNESPNNSLKSSRVGKRKRSIFGSSNASDDEDEALSRPNSKTPSNSYNSYLAYKSFSERDLWSWSRLKREKSTSELLLRYRLGLGSNAYLRPSTSIWDINHRFVPQANALTVIENDAPIYVGQFFRDGYYFSADQNFNLKIYNTSVENDPRLEVSRNFSIGNWSITDVSYRESENLFLVSSLSSQLAAVNWTPACPKDMKIRATPVITSAGHSPIFSCDLDYKCDKIALGSKYNAFVGDYLNFENSETIFKHPKDVNSVRFINKAGTQFLTGCDDGIVRHYDTRARNKTPVNFLIGHRSGITYAEEDESGNYVISNSKDQTIKLWDLRFISTMESDAQNIQNFDYRVQKFVNDNKPIKDASTMTYSGHTVYRTLIRCHFSPYGSTGNQYIYSGSVDGSVYIWHIDGSLVSVLDNTQTDDLFALGNVSRNRRQLKNAFIRDVSWSPLSPSIYAARGHDYGGEVLYIPFNQKFVLGNISSDEFSEKDNDNSVKNVGILAGQSSQLYRNKTREKALQKMVDSRKSLTSSPEPRVSFANRFFHFLRERMSSFENGDDDTDLNREDEESDENEEYDHARLFNIWLSLIVQSGLNGNPRSSNFSSPLVVPDGLQNTEDGETQEHARNIEERIIDVNPPPDILRMLRQYIRNTDNGLPSMFDENLERLESWFTDINNISDDDDFDYFDDFVAGGDVDYDDENNSYGTNSTRPRSVHIEGINNPLPLIFGGVITLRDEASDHDEDNEDEEDEDEDEDNEDEEYDEDNYDENESFRFREAYYQRFYDDPYAEPDDEPYDHFSYDSGSYYD